MESKYKTRGAGDLSVSLIEINTEAAAVTKFHGSRDRVQANITPRHTGYLDDGWERPLTGSRSLLWRKRRGLSLKRINGLLACGKERLACKCGFHLCDD
jgi:hypothetical protein